MLDLTRSYHNLLQKEEAGKRQTFLWDGNVAGIINEDSVPDFYFQDELGSPIRVADMEGTLRETQGYDEFGQSLYWNQVQVQPFGYTGYQSDQITGMYYAQAREYVPSVGKFASRDLDKFIKIQNGNTLNMYNYCVSNPLRYLDPSGNTLEDILNEQYPDVAKHKDNDAVQINISGNDVTIDVYVDFIGEENLTTANGTSCKDLAIAGIEQWSGYYLDVFGEDIYVTVNVHEGDSSIWNQQKYVKICFESNKYTGDKQRPQTDYGFFGWSNSSRKIVYMYNHDLRNQTPYTDENYLRTITHEMGHVFGIEDGYGDESEKGWIDNILEGWFDIETRRPDAFKSNVINEHDVMRTQFDELDISNTDIGMLILAYRTNQNQAYADYYTNFMFYRQSNYIGWQEEKE